MTSILKGIIAVMFLLGLMFGAGWYYGRNTAAKEVQTVVTKGDDKIVYKDRIVTVTKTVNKDGTTTETTKTEDQAKTDDKQTETTATDTKPILAPITQYSLGLKYRYKYVDLLPTSVGVNNIEVSGGRRLLGNAWLDLGVSRDQLTLGVRYEF